MTNSLHIVPTSSSGTDSSAAGGSCGSKGAVTLTAASSNGVAATELKGRAAIVTLGCAKNQVDSEVMLGVLHQSGYEIVNDVTRADVAIVNTCGFLESAVQEGIDTILDLSELKAEGSLRQLVVAGCMVSRYTDELKESMPEVDAFLSTDEILQVGDAAEGRFKSILHEGARPHFLYNEEMPRILSDRPWLSYVKVAEGCNRPCTFCIIPKIRGAMRSRSIESVTAEVRHLGAMGVKEVNLVAQDLTSFGRDHREGNLADLLQALNDTAAVPWIRTLYAYPVGTDERLLKTIQNGENICNYFDIPLQHASEKVLRAMQRPIGRFASRPMTEFIRTTAPELAIRTTFIVGFPGETEEDVRELETLVAEGHYSSVGVFTYSPERGTPSAEMDGQVPEEERQARRERIMLAQQAAQARRLEALVGKTLPVLVEGEHPETELLISGRTAFQAPEVDGCVMINEMVTSDGEFRELAPASLQGSIHDVEITEVAGYDLVGTLRLEEMD